MRGQQDAHTRTSLHQSISVKHAGNQFSDSGTTTKPAHDTGTSMEIKSMSKLGQTLISLITGLFKHLQRMNLINSPLCKLCRQEDETLEHISCYCSGLMKIQIQKPRNSTKKPVETLLSHYTTTQQYLLVAVPSNWRLSCLTFILKWSCIKQIKKNVCTQEGLNNR